MEHPQRSQSAFTQVYFSYTVWASRHLTQEQAADLEVSRSYFGRGVFGAQDAAQLYFEKSLDELSRAELVALFTISGASHYDPWCKRSSFDRGYEHMLSRAAKNGLTIDDAEVRFVEPPPGTCPDQK